MKTKKPVDKTSRVLKPGGIPNIITACPKDAQPRLKEIRAAIGAVVPDAFETPRYFNMSGYSYAGYVYSGMFAQFSFKQPYVRLHVRPEVTMKFKKVLAKYSTTKAIVRFPIDKAIPKAILQKLVKTNLKSMKDVGRTDTE